MAIAKMNQFTLLTFQDRRDSLLKALQKFGDVQFRDLGKQEPEELDFLHQEYSQQDISRYESELDRVTFTLSKLSPHVAKAGLTASRQTLSYEEFDGFLSHYDYLEVCGFVKERDDKISAVRSETARIKAENEGLKNWLKLDVAPDELDGLSTVRYLIGTVNTATAHEFQETLQSEFPCTYIEFVGQIKDDTALLILTDTASFDDLFEKTREMGFSKTGLSFRDVPKKIVEDNNRRIEELESEGEKALVDIKSKAPEHPQLLIVKDCLQTLLVRERAAENFLSSDRVVMIEGWVPEDDDAAFMEAVKASCGDECYLEKTPVEKDSAEVPIKLKNNGVVSAFESITNMYSTPRYNELDPTPILTPFYWLFFGLMTGDIGYGLLLLVATLIIMKVVDLKEGMRNFMKFFHILSYGTILGGLLYGGAFGVTIFKPLPYGAGGYKAILDSNLDIVTMIVISIAIGIFHIFFGLGVKAYMGFRDGDYGAAVFDAIFWILAVGGGIGWILGIAGMLPATATKVFMWIFWAAIIGLALTQGRSSPSIGGKIGNGLYGVYGITSYVGDIVSYTRIVALALSSAYIAYAFNLMVGLLPTVARFTLGIVIILFGHALNLGLALLGAYVHTCRLQYVEFFGKFYEGGGLPFKPFKLQHDNIHIK